MTPTARPTRTVAGIAIERDLEMRSRDGTTLRADVYRPAHQSRPLPVLLLRTPYDKQMADDATYMHPAWYARQGFIVVIQDIRGRHCSEGVFDPFVNEGPDGADAVEWAAQLAGSNGRVGMYGASYPGYLQLQAAAERPPSLAAIAPAVTSADPHGHWTYEGGALNLGFVAWWAAALSSVDMARLGRTDLLARLGPPVADPRTWFASAAPIDLDPLPEAAPYYVEWLSHPTRDAFWDRRCIDTRLDTIDIPVLMIAGWFDVFLAGGIEAHRSLVELGKEDQELVVGPWMHYPWGPDLGGYRFGAVGQGTRLVDDAQVRFFKRHLDADSVDVPAATTEDPVRYFVLFEDAWRTARSWPPPDAREVVLYLASGGSANGLGGDGRLATERIGDDPFDVYGYLPAIPVPASGGHSCCYQGRSPMGIADQTTVEQLAQVLVYTSDRLVSPIVIAGLVRAELWVSTDAVSADYTAKLCVVDDSGSWNIAEGIARVAPRSPGELDADRSFHVTVSLRSIAARVDAGRRLRLEITSGAFPTWSVNPQDGRAPERTAPAAGRAAIHALHHDAIHDSRLVLTCLEAPFS